MAVLYNTSFFQPSDINGLPLAGAKLFFYEAGTTTLITVYQDTEETTPTTNPVIADASGIFPTVYIAYSPYKTVLKTALDITVQTVDNIETGIGSGAAAKTRAALSVAPFVDTRTDLKAVDTTLEQLVYLTEDGRQGWFEFRAGDYSTQVSADTTEGIYIKADGVSTTSGAWVRVFDGIPHATWFGIQPGLLTPQSAAFQAAIDVSKLFGRPSVELDPGSYVASGLTNLDGFTFRGDGAYFSNLTYRVVPYEPGARFAVPSDVAAWCPVTEYGFSSDGKPIVDFDVYQYWLSQETQGTNEIYVDYDLGNDSTGTGTVNNAYKTLQPAVDSPVVGIIYLMADVTYCTSGVFGSATYDRDIEIKSFDGKMKTIRVAIDPAVFSWSAESSFNYKTTCTTPAEVYDMSLTDEYGDFKKLVNRASVADVTNNPGSWYYNSGTGTLYVRKFTNEIPATEILATRSSPATVSARAIYLENIKIEGQGINLTDNSGVKARIYWNGGGQKYSINNGIEMDGSNAYLQNLEIARSLLDGVNYTESVGANCTGIEINVISRHNGDPALAGDQNKNGSSNHHNGKIARFGGEYHHNYGPNVVDTGKCNSFNVGVKAYQSIAIDADFKINFAHGDNSNGDNMYLHRCSSWGSTRDYQANKGNLQIAECADSGVYFEAQSTAHVLQYWPTKKVTA